MHPIEQRLERLRSRIHRLTLWYGLGRLLFVGVGMFLILGLSDYLVRFEDRGLRIMATAAWCLAVGRTVYRRIHLALRDVPSRLALARYLGRCFPPLENDLACAVEFLGKRDDDPTAGSPALRRAVIARAEADLQRIPIDDAIRSQPVFRVAAIGLATVLAASAIAAIDPQATSAAALRLAAPFGNTPWPRQTHLIVRQPVERIAKGRPFEVEVTDRRGARLPNEVRILYRFIDDEGDFGPAEEEPMRFVNGAMTARRENVRQSFAFRVEGGDDRTMPWHSVEVVDPPAVESLAVSLHPPAYTGRPVESADCSFRALAGTRVAWTGKASTPITSAVLCWEGGREFPAKIGDDGRTFSLAADADPAFLVETSGTYRIRLTDAEGFVGGDDRPYDVRAVADSPPAVTIERPRTDVFVTPQAVLPLEIRVRDDFAVSRVELEYARSDAGDRPPVVMELYAGKIPAAAASSGPPLAGDDRTIRRTWELAPLALQPGMQLTFRAAGADFQPRVAKSDPRRLHVVTPQEMTERIASRQTAVLEELARVLQMQRQCRASLAPLASAAAQRGSLTGAEIESLRSAELSQRRVHHTLTERTDGIPSYSAALSDDMECNRIDMPDVRERMARLSAETARLGREELPRIAAELTAAAKAAQVVLDERASARNGTPQAEPEIARALTTAGREQDRVVETLTQLLGDLGRWDRFRRFHREMSRILADEEDLVRQSGELARATLAKELRDLTAQERRDLEAASRMQTDLAQRMDRLEHDMTQAIAPLRSTDPAAATMADEAARWVRRSAPAALMRSAASHLDQNRMGRAVAAQREAVENLREAVDLLSGGRERSGLRAAGRWDRLRHAVDALLQRQTHALEQTLRTAKRSPDDPSTNLAKATAELAAEQALIRSETIALAERRRGAVSLVLGSAAGEMNVAAARLERNRLDAPTQTAQRRALAHLKQLADTLQKENERAASEPTTPDGAGRDAKTREGGVSPNLPSAVELKLLQSLQQDLLRRTQEAETLARGTGEAADAARRRLIELAAEQERLGDLVVEMIRNAENAERETPDEK